MKLLSKELATAKLTRILAIAGVAAIIIVLGRWIYVSIRPKPTRMLCPISPTSVSRPTCQLYTGQRYGKNRHHLLPAVELDKNQLGLYKKFDGELTAFTDVGFNPYPAPYSVIYPQEVLLYKTERATDDPAKCPPHLTQYALCDTPIDRVVFGEGVEGEVDLAIAFKLEATPENLEQLYDIGGASRFIDLFKQVVRGNRQLTSIQANVANTEEGSKQIEQSFRQALSNWSLSHLFTVETVSVRSVVVGSPSYRQQQESQVSKLAQQELREQSLAFERNQQIQDAEGFAQSIDTICQNIPPERCPEMIWVLMYGGKLQPFLDREGNLISPVPIPPAGTSRQ